MQIPMQPPCWRKDQSLQEASTFAQREVPAQVARAEFAPPLGRQGGNWLRGSVGGAFGSFLHV